MRRTGHLLAATLCTLLAAGCHHPVTAVPARAAAPPPVAPAPVANTPEAAPANPAPPPSPQPQATVTVADAPRRVAQGARNSADESSGEGHAARSVSVPNVLYHPGRSESLDISGTFSGQESVTLSGTISFIVTRESSHGRPVNVMNTTVVLRGPDGKRKQFEHQAVYELRHDGRLQLLYKSEDDQRLWVESSTCAGEPRNYVDGHSDGCEIHFDDGSMERSTSAVNLDGDYLKVTTITKSTDKSGARDSTETYWLDPSTGHFVRYSGAVSGPDGMQLTLTGR